MSPVQHKAIKPHHQTATCRSSPSPPQETGTTTSSKASQSPATATTTTTKDIPPLRIAILLNSYNSPYISSLKRSYERCLLSLSPSSSLSFYYPAHHPDTDGMKGFPEPSAFDLIVVGGSNVDPRKTHPWVLRVHQYIRDVVRETPQKKMVGICWGHQTMALVFGGKVRDMDVPELGVTTNTLTPRGKHFFRSLYSTNSGGSSNKLRIQQHHRREVSHPAPGFIPLLEDKQAYINGNNTIITLQGHPEKDAQTALLRLNDASRWYGMDVSDPAVKDRLKRRIEGEHDGDLVWRRILEWVVGSDEEEGVARL